MPPCAILARHSTLLPHSSKEVFCAAGCGCSEPSKNRPTPLRLLLATQAVEFLGWLPHYTKCSVLVVPYVYPGAPRYRKIARGPIEVWWPIADPRAEMIVRRRIGIYIYERRVETRGLLDIQEAAVALNGADRTTVYRLIKSGRLRAMKDQGRILVPRQDIERYLMQVALQRRGRRLGESWGRG